MLNSALCWPSLMIMWVMRIAQTMTVLLILEEGSKAAFLRGVGTAGHWTISGRVGVGFSFVVLLMG